MATLGRMAGGTLLLLVAAGCATVPSASELKAKGRLDEAAAVYTRALQDNPRQAEPALGLAEILSLKKMVDESIRVLEQAHQRMPQDGRLTQRLADAYTDRGKRYQAQGRISDAYEAWQKALALVPDHPGAKTALAGLYAEGHEQPAEQLQQITQTRPSDGDAHNALGLAYFRQDRLDDALSEFQQALRLSPQDARLFNNLGSVHLKAGRLAEALTAFEQSAVLDPKLSATQNNLGTVYFQQGRYQRARTAWELAAQLDRSNETVRQNLDALASLGY